MKFTPKTEAEVSSNLWPEGEYNFQIINDISLGQSHYLTKDTTSRKGNEMIQLVVKVYNEAGRDITVIDYLLEAIDYKLRHAAYACGLGGSYETGNLLAENFIGKSGKLKLKIDKDKTGQYSDRNVVADYIVPEKTSAQLEHSQQKANGFQPDTSPILDDEVPF